MTGKVQDAVREAVPPGMLLATPSGRGQFTIARYTTDALVLLLGVRQWPTRLPWRALEEISDLLRGRDWVLIGSVYSHDSPRGSLDEHLKKYQKRATAGWGGSRARKGSRDHHRSLAAIPHQTPSRLVAADSITM